MWSMKTLIPHFIIFPRIRVNQGNTKNWSICSYRFAFVYGLIDIGKKGADVNAQNLRGYWHFIDSNEYRRNSFALCSLQRKFFCHANPVKSWSWCELEVVPVRFVFTSKRDINEETPLHYVARYFSIGVWFTCARVGIEEAVTVLLKAGADVNLHGKDGSPGEVLLFWSSCSAEQVASAPHIRLLLQSNGAPT